MLILQLLLPVLILFPIIDIFFNSSPNGARKEIIITDFQASEREKEINALAQMRLLGQELMDGDDFYKTDNFLLRWLKAKNFNVVAAIKMAQEAKEWKIKNRIDVILNETIYDFGRPYYKVDGADKEGRPIIVLKPNRVDARKLQLTGKHEDVVRCLVQMMEHAFQTVKNLKQPTNGKIITGTVSIFDAAGLNLQQHMCLRCIPVLVDGVRHLENYYPGLNELIIIVNMNRFMAALKSLVTPLTSSQTFSTLKLFGTNRTEWSEYLLSVIPADQLGRYFGGTRPDF